MTAKNYFTPEEIRLKLEKYFDAVSSLEEENQLKAYFSSSEIAPEFEQYRPLFTYTKEAQKEQVKPLPLQLQRTSIARWKIPIAAASFIGIITLASFLFRMQQQTQRQQAQLAYQQVREALQIISENYNKGTDKLVYLKEFQTTTQKVIKTEKF